MTGFEDFVKGQEFVVTDESGHCFKLGTVVVFLGIRRGSKRFGEFKGAGTSQSLFLNQVRRKCRLARKKE